MWHRILESLGRGYRDRDRASAARRAFESAYPELEAIDVWLRARETDRDVVAVLYRQRNQRNTRATSRGMPLYKLYSVGGELVTEQLQRDPSSRYAIRGIK